MKKRTVVVMAILAAMVLPFLSTGCKTVNRGKVKKEIRQEFRDDDERNEPGGKNKNKKNKK